MSPKTAPSAAPLAEQEASPRQETRSRGLDLLSASREWETTAASVARLAVETFCDWSIIDMLDDAGMQHRVAVDHADPSKADLAMEIRRYPPNPGLTPAASETIRAGRSLLASIVREQEIDSRARDNRQAELARKIGMASYIVSPLVARGRVLGTVSFMRVNRKRPFTQGDVSRAEEMARQAALAIDNARLAAEASKTAERVARLQNITAALSEAVTPLKVADAVLEQAMASLEAETGAVWLVNALANRAELLSHRNFNDTSVEEYRILPLDRRSPMTDAIGTGEAVWLGSRSEYARHYPDNKAVELIPHELATACLPLVVDRRVIGGVALSFPHARFIGPSERAFLLAIARQCAQALERAQLYEKERAARAEAESAHRLLEAVVQAAPIGISLLDRDGTVRMWNPAFERITGWPAEEALGRVAPSIPEQRREELLSKFGRVVAGKPVEPYEGPRHRKNGDPYTAAVWMSRLERGEEKPQVLVMMADVTERKRDEDWQRFLAQAGDVFSSSLDYEQTLQAVAKLAVPALATVAMVDGPHLNPREPLAVASEDPAQEALVREIRRRYPLRDVDAISVAFRTGKARLSTAPGIDAIRRFVTDEEQARMIRETRLRSSMVVPLIARGQTLGVFSLASAERIYEPRDLAFAEELARRAAIAIDNARLYRESQEAVRLREDFVNIAGFELRTPLAAVHLQLQSMLRMARRGEATAKITERAESATRNMDRLLALANDLLDTSWITGRKLSLECSRFDLVEEVSEVMGRLRGELARSGCEAVLDAELSVRGSWDRLRVAQVVASLLSNAMKYGGGKPVHVRVEESGGRALLEVRDQGIGIAPEDQARIFSRFERAGAPSHYGGLGLGLWKARQIVEAHGGSIRVESTPGQGATFRVELPLTKPEPAAP